MKIKFLSNEALIDLKMNFESYKEYLLKFDDEWIDQYLTRENRILESSIDLKEIEFNYDDNYAISDRENVKKVYKSLKHLTVKQATQEKLWAGLALIQLRHYSQYRLQKDMEKNNNQRIKSGLFFVQGSKRSLFIHILSRLWWVGYMTYDKSNHQNPYWLTDFFCESDFSARATIFFSSNFTSNRDITKGILKALFYLQQNGIKITRNHFVEANKYLNIVGAARILDMLTIKEVESMVINYLGKIDSNINNIKKHLLIN